MNDSVSTVLGPVSADDLGRVLPHEHIASVYGRWGKQRSEPCEAWERGILEHYLPILTRLRQEYDCRTLVEVSPSWGFRQARDLEVWAELSRRSGVHIVVATGYYTSAVRPPDFGERSIAELADHMIEEITQGIAGTGVRAGIIKIAVQEFDADDRKLIRAAAIAQRETGLSITTHTCTPSVRRGLLDVLEGAGVPPTRIYLGHADTNGTPSEHLALVRRGCNLLFTIWGITDPGICWELPALPRYHSPGLTAFLVAEGYGDRVLASVDYSAGYEGDRLVQDLYQVEDRTHQYLFAHSLSALQRMGVTAEEVERILRENPRRMLVVEAT